MLSGVGQPHCIGNCGVLPSDSLLMLGYGLKRRYWGKGYMNEAIPLLLDLYWTQRPSVQQPHAKVNPENLPSVRILVKNGFTEQDVLVGNANLRAKGLREPILYKLERPP